MELTQRVIAEAQQLVLNGRSSEATYFLEKMASECLNALAAIHANQWDEKKALGYTRLATELDFDSWATHSNACHTYSLFRQYDDAKVEAKKAISLSDGTQYAAIFNAAVVFANRMEVHSAVELYHKAVSMWPENNMVHYNLACSLLAIGRFEQAWPEYEYRLKAFDSVRQFVGRFENYPVWTGENLSDKSILIYNEQGVGDLIFFSRYLPKIKAKRVIVEVQQEVLTILRDSFPKIEFVGRDNGPIYADPPKADYAVSVCSLPYRLKMKKLKDIPSEPYLKAKGEPILNNKRKIGFSWAGNANHALDDIRTIPLHWFRQISDLESVSLYSLQKDSPRYRSWRGCSIDLLSGSAGIRYNSLVNRLTDFRGTAECIQEMDLIITVDSALAHVAAAMGKPVWMLTPFIADWRWLTETNDSPWYPSMRLFRQPRLGDWETVFMEVASALVEDSDLLS